MPHSAPRFALVALLLSLGALLAWEFASAFPRWSNGWPEGATYALGALLAWASAFFLARRGPCRRPLLLCAGVALLLAGAWSLRAAFWLLAVGPEIGPAPFWAVLPFALAGLLALAGAALAVRAAVRARE